RCGWASSAWGSSTPTSAHRRSTSSPTPSNTASGTRTTCWASSPSSSTASCSSPWSRSSSSRSTPTTTAMICVALVMVITTLLMTIVMLLVWKVNIWWIAAFFVVFMSTETVYLSAVLYKFTQGPYFPLAMSAVLMVIMIVWHYVHVKRYKYELQHTVSPDEVKHLLERHDLKRVPGLGLFYTELVQGIPPIFPHLIEKIPTVHSVIVFISVKHLPIPHVDVQERFLFRQVEPKESMVFRCVARYGYRDTLEMAGDFVATLVEYLQYYVRD
ncbi:hypothetical protein CFC21_084345, partial [Triticum aestivum]